jgi:hypothetical protein
MSAQINLINPALRKKKEYFSSRVFMVALAACTLIMMAASAWVGYETHTKKMRTLSAKTLLNGAKEELATVTAQKVPRAKNERLEAQVKDMEARVLDLLKVTAELKKDDFGNATGYSGYLRAFARQRLDGIWLTGVSVRDQGNDIGLQGQALQAVLLPQYLQRLSGEEVLRGKAFDSLSMQRKAAPVSRAPTSSAAVGVANTPVPTPQAVAPGQNLGIDSVVANAKDISNAINNPAALSALLSKLGEQQSRNSAANPVAASPTTGSAPAVVAANVVIDPARLPIEFSLQAHSVQFGPDGKEIK